MRPRKTPEEIRQRKLNYSKIWRQKNKLKIREYNYKKKGLLNCDCNYQNVDYDLIFKKDYYDH